MSYQNQKIAKVAEVLKKRLVTLEYKPSILRSPELKALAAEITQLSPNKRAEFGRELNQLKAELEELVKKALDSHVSLDSIDVTAPFDVNTQKKPKLLTADNGSKHPLMSEIEIFLDI
jgi:hypothetical protein